MSILAVGSGVVLVIVGLVHLSGVLAAWDSRGTGFNERPWIISQHVTLHDPVGRLFGFPWLFASLALLIAGFDPIYQFGFWPWLPIAGAASSLIAIVPWWNTVPLSAKVCAVFDLVILAMLLPPWRDRILAMLF